MDQGKQKFIGPQVAAVREIVNDRAVGTGILVDMVHAYVRTGVGPKLKGLMHLEIDTNGRHERGRG